MTDQIKDWLNELSNLGILAITLIIPFLFWNLTSEYYETPKFLAVALFTAILFLIWALKFVTEGKVKITRTPLDLWLLLILGTAIISTIFSSSHSVSILGNLPRISDSLAAIVVYILFYFALIYNLKQTNLAQHIITLLTISGIILAGVALLSYAGVYLPPAWTKTPTFTPSGSIFSTNAILILTLPFLLFSLLHNNNFVSKIVVGLVLILYGTVLALTGSAPEFIAAAAVLILTFLAAPKNEVKKALAFILLPILVASGIWFLGSPKLGTKNNFYQKAQNFQDSKEIQLPFQASWSVAVTAFRDRPLVGSGPGTFMFDFTTYKPIEINQTSLWNIRFDQPFNEYLLFLATVGGSGLVALLILTVAFLSSAYKTLSSMSSIYNQLAKPVAISGVIFFVLLALHSATVVVWIVGILILACYMIVNKNVTEDLEIGISAVGSKSNQLRFDLLPGILLLLILGLIGYSLFWGTKATLADISHRKALNAAAQNRGLDAYNALVAAENLNPYVDLYRANLAQTNFALANSIAASKGPTQASPSGSLTDADKQNIQVLLSQAINEGRAATTLSPNNAANWEILGSIYRQISGVAQNAFQFALDSYGHAIQLDQFNPVLRLTVGGIYYSAQNYDQAVRFFTDSVTIKPDYTNGYYNLAIALRDKGDIKSAIAAATQATSLLSDQNSSDYKVASQLLKSLQEKEATQTAQVAPASQTNSALQGKNLPNVLNLPQPESIATPPAVKK
ncbi:O-antigen ligase family protein [Candidatus Daviesbacteria bacterium]|nr:O-antigen ligase family protein [Candidatus Daviesbacteria bacterium]